MKTKVKLFTNTDVEQHGAIPNAGKLYADTSDLLQAQTSWQKLGLQQTATGYGRKLNSGFKINFNGRLYRLYVTCFSNASSLWFKASGRTIYVSM